VDNVRGGNGKPMVTTSQPRHDRLNKGIGGGASMRHGDSKRETLVGGLKTEQAVPLVLLREPSGVWCEREKGNRRKKGLCPGAS